MQRLSDQELDLAVIDSFHSRIAAISPKPAPVLEPAILHQSRQRLPGLLANAAAAAIFIATIGVGATLRPEIFILPTDRHNHPANAPLCEALTELGNNLATILLTPSIAKPKEVL